MEGLVTLTPTQMRFAALVLAMSNFIVVLDMTVANVSIPHIAGSLGVSLDQGAWVITTYSMAEAIAVPLTGWLVQRFGAVRLYIFCMSGFGLFSLLCGLSQTLDMIVICRIGQGLCGGLMMPLSQTLLFTIFTGGNRAKAMLLAAMTTMLGPALGPNVGGLISDNLSWHWIFLINIPIVMFCILSIYGLMGGSDTQRRKVPVDLVGLLLMALWIGCFQLLLDIGRNRDWFADPLVLTLGIAAVLAFVAFVIWELTDEHPIVNLRIFRHPGFTSGVVALSMCYGAYYASIVVIPQWLQSTMGYPAMSAGFIVSGTAIASLLTSGIASKALAKGVDPRIMVSGAVVWIAMMALLRSNWTSGADFWTIAMPQLLQGLTMSFFMLPLTTIALGSVDPDELASATGLQNFVRTLTTGIATATALTFWSNATQTAHSDIVGRMQTTDAMGTLTGSGITDMQSRGILANMVDREAVIVALDETFVATAILFLICAAVIWIAPRPKSGGVAAIGR